MKDSKSPEAKNKPDGYDSFSVYKEGKGSYYNQKGLKTKHDDGEVEKLNPDDSEKISKTQSIKRHYLKKADAILNRYKKSTQGKSEGSFKKLSEELQSFKRKVYDETAAKALELANKNRRYGEKATEVPSFSNDYNSHLTNNYTDMDSVARRLKEAGRHGTPSTWNQREYNEQQEKDKRRKGHRSYGVDTGEYGRTPKGAHDAILSRDGDPTLNREQVNKKEEEYNVRRHIAKHLRKLKKKGLSESLSEELCSRIEQIAEDIVSQAVKNLDKAPRTYQHGDEFVDSPKRTEAAGLLRKAVNTFYDSQKNSKAPATKNEIGDKKTDARRKYMGMKSEREAIEASKERHKAKEDAKEWGGSKSRRGEGPRGKEQALKNTKEKRRSGDDYMDLIAQKSPGVSFTSDEWNDNY